MVERYIHPREDRSHPPDGDETISTRNGNLDVVVIRGNRGRRNIPPRLSEQR